MMKTAYTYLQYRSVGVSSCHQFEARCSLFGCHLKNVFIYCNFHGFRGLSTFDSIDCMYSMNNKESRFKHLI